MQSHHQYSKGGFPSTLSEFGLFDRILRLDAGARDRSGTPRCEPRGQFRGREGLDEVVGRARLQGFGDGLVAPVGGDEHHRHIVEFGDVPHQLDAVGIGQHEIQQHQMRLLGADNGRQLRVIARHQRGVARLGERVAREAQHLGVVVDDQHPGGPARFRVRAGRARIGARPLPVIPGHRDGEGEARALAGAAALGPDAPAVRLHQPLQMTRPRPVLSIARSPSAPRYLRKSCGSASGAMPLREGTGDRVLGFRDKPVTNATTAGPWITGVEIVSKPSLETDGDGETDTYGRDGKIAVEVTFNKAVTVTGADSDVKVRLDLGADDADRADNRRTASLQSSAGATLRFEYAVQRIDIDADGVWVQTVSASDPRVLFLTGGATVTDPDSDEAAALIVYGLPSAGDGRHRVDGGLEPDTTAPALRDATVDGSTAVLTFTEALAPGSGSVPETAFAVDGPGDDDPEVTGVAFDANEATKLTLTLDGAVPFGDATKLQDSNGNTTDAFSVAATNKAPNPDAPVPQSARVAGSEVEIEFDKGISATSLANAGPGVWTVTVAGTGKTPSNVGTTNIGSPGRPLQVNLDLGAVNKPAAGEAVTVAYAKGINPVTGTNTFAVADFELTANNAPEATAAEAVGTSLTLTFDTPLDGNKTPAGSAFRVRGVL